VIATADVRADHYNVGTDHRVVIQNIGTGEARNVTVENVAAGNDPHDDERSWQLLGARGAYRLPRIRRDAAVPVPITFGSPPRVNVTVRWLNPDDSEGSSRQTLSIY
jgi:hypothetical protein